MTTAAVELSRTAIVRFLIARIDEDEVGLLELVLGLEGSLEDGIGQQVAHFQAHKRLTAAGCGRADVGIEAGVGDVFEFEYGLALDVDCFDECCHGPS